MRRNDTTKIGDLGEAEALRLLTERGYSGSNLNDVRRNTWTYDLQIKTARGLVKISVKTARAKRDVSLGRPRSLKRLADDAFLMILMPPGKKQEIRIVPGGYHLLIVPGHVVRDEALSMHYDYWGDEIAKAEENTVRVKDEVNRPGSRSCAGHVFASWNENFRDAWYLLPEPSPQGHVTKTSSREMAFSEPLAPQTARANLYISPSKAGQIAMSSSEISGPEDRKMTMTPQEIVQSLKYLERAGMSASEACQMHHFPEHQSYEKFFSYFGKTSRLGSDTNRCFGDRLAYVVREHKAGRRDSFAPLILEARNKWPLPR